MGNLGCLGILRGWVEFGFGVGEMLGEMVDEDGG
jgi:hypothetical protein